MVRPKKKKNKLIIVVCLLIVFMASSLASVSFAWFTDKKNADIDITVSQSTSGKVEVPDSQKLLPSDLIAGNEFQKNISISFKSDIEVVFRTYAVVSTQCYENGTKTTKDSIVSLTNVSSSKKGTDNEYYYSLDGTNLSSITTQTITLTYTFNVSSNFNDEIFRNSTGEIDKTLKTTIKYFVEYRESTNTDEWAKL